jgi:hypothetical protein
MTKSVVLLARVDDPQRGVTIEQRSTIVSVEHHEEASASEIAEMAMELAPPVTEWMKY